MHCSAFQKLRATDERAAPVASWIDDASLGSSTPSAYLAFLPSFTRGRFVFRKVCSISVASDSDTALICSSASTAVVKGLNATSDAILLKRAMSVIDACTFVLERPTLSRSLISKRL